MKAHLLRLLVSTALLGCFPAASHAVARVGEQVNFQFKAVDGTPVSTELLKGKLVVVDFWATWCGPCMQMAPHMVEMNQKYGGKGLQIIGISLDEDRAQMVQVTRQRGMVWPEYFDGLVWKNKIWAQYGSNGIPFTILLSPEGTVLFAGHPAAGLDQAVERAFKEHPPQLVDPAVLAQAGQQLDEVEKTIASGDTRGALKQLGKVPAGAMADEKLAGRVSDVQKKLGAAADAALADVQTQINQGHFGEAGAQLKGLSNALAGLPEAAKAKKMYLELMARPDARAAIADEQRNARGQEALTVAEHLQAQKKDELAYGRFKEIAKAYAGTDAAANAQKQVDAYEKDAAFMRSIGNKHADSKARAALSLAANYKQAGNVEMARKKYQSVIDEFPGTPSAEDAKKGLRELDQ